MPTDFKTYLDDLNKNASRQYSAKEVLNIMPHSEFTNIPDIEEEEAVQQDYVTPKSTNSQLDRFLSKHSDRDPEILREGFNAIQERVKNRDGIRYGEPITADHLEELGRKRIEAQAPPLWKEGMKSLARGVVQLPTMAGKGLQWLDPDGGSNVVENAGQAMEQFSNKYQEKFRDDIAPSKQAELSEWYSPRRMFAYGPENLVASAVPMVAGLGVGAVAGGAAGIAAGLGTLGTLFYGGSAEEKYRQAKEHGLDDDAAFTLANWEGGIEAGGEIIADLIPLGLFGKATKAVQGGVIKSIAQGEGLKGVLKTIGLTMVGETTTEVAQAAAQTAISNKMGVDVGGVGENVADVIAPTIFMSLVFGGVAGVARHQNLQQNKKAIIKTLSNPDATQEDFDTALKMVVTAASDIDKTAAKNFEQYAIKQRQAGQPIVVKDDDAYTPHKQALAQWATTGQRNGEEFTPDHAYSFIREKMQTGDFTDDDLQDIKNNTPVLADVVNRIDAERVVESANQMANIWTGIENRVEQEEINQFDEEWKARANPNKKQGIDYTDQVKRTIDYKLRDTNQQKINQEEQNSLTPPSETKDDWKKQQEEIDAGIQAVRGSKQEQRLSQIKKEQQQLGEQFQQDHQKNIAVKDKIDASQEMESRQQNWIDKEARLEAVGRDIESTKQKNIEYQEKLKNDPTFKARRKADAQIEKISTLDRAMDGQRISKDQRAIELMLEQSKNTQTRSNFYDEATGQRVQVPADSPSWMKEITTPVGLGRKDIETLAVKYKEQILEGKPNPKNPITDKQWEQIQSVIIPAIDKIKKEHENELYDQSDYEADGYKFVKKDTPVLALDFNIGDTLLDFNGIAGESEVIERNDSGIVIRTPDNQTHKIDDLDGLNITAFKDGDGTVKEVEGYTPPKTATPTVETPDTTDTPEITKLKERETRLIGEIENATDEDVIKKKQARLEKLQGFIDKAQSTVETETTEEMPTIEGLRQKLVGYREREQALQTKIDNAKDDATKEHLNKNLERVQGKIAAIEPETPDVDSFNKILTRLNDAKEDEWSTVSQDKELTGQYKKLTPEQQKQIQEVAAKKRINFAKENAKNFTSGEAIDSWIQKRADESYEGNRGVFIGTDEYKTVKPKIDSFYKKQKKEAEQEIEKRTKEAARRDILQLKKRTVDMTDEDWSNAFAENGVRGSKYKYKNKNIVDELSYVEDKRKSFDSLKNLPEADLQNAIEQHNTNYYDDVKIEDIADSPLANRENLTNQAGIVDDSKVSDVTPDIPEQRTLPDGSTIKVFKNTETNMETHIKKTAKGYSVSLWDTDANEATPTVSIYPTEEQAIEKAKEVLPTKAEQSPQPQAKEAWQMPLNEYANQFNIEQDTKKQERVSSIQNTIDNLTDADVDKIWSEAVNNKNSKTEERDEGFVIAGKTWADRLIYKNKKDAVEAILKKRLAGAKKAGYDMNRPQQLHRQAVEKALADGSLTAEEADKLKHFQFHRDLQEKYGKPAQPQGTERGDTPPEVNTQRAEAEEKETLTPEQLADYGLYKERGGKYKYKNSPTNPTWLTANSKEDAIRLATKNFYDLKPEERLTKTERDDIANKEYDAEKKRRWGKLSIPELEEKLLKLGGELEGLQDTAQNEFNGNGGRSSKSAVAAEGARDLGQVKMMLKSYIAERKAKEAAEKGEVKQPSTYGTKNKVFTADRAEKARELLKRKLSGTQLNAGIDPEIMLAGIELGGYHVEAGARKFVDFAEKMIADIGESIRPYLKSFYNAVRDFPEFDNEGMNTYQEVEEIIKNYEKGGKYESNINSNSNMERDSRDTGTKDGLGEKGVQDEPRGNDGVGESGIPKDEKTGDTNRSNESVFRPKASTTGERGNITPHTEDTESTAKGSNARDNNDSRGGDIGFTGAERTTHGTTQEQADKAVSERLDLNQRLIAQKKVNSTTKIKLADKADIEKTLPLLLPKQQDDVLFAEKRFSNPDGIGVMFTNGTGTGKTFSALGIVKRAEMQGKKNILIVAPDDLIIDAWTKASSLFGLNISKLANTKDAGQGINITTYANFGNNQELINRNWDLIVTDESHQLSMNKSGDRTSALSTLKAITMHKDGWYARHKFLDKDLIAEFEDISNKINSLTEEFKQNALNNQTDKNPSLVAKREKLIPKQREIQLKLDALRKQRKEEVQNFPQEKRPRVVFLSATPFAYEKNVDYAEGYLFDYPKVERGGYNSGDGHDQFFIQHFGYRMKYNKLTEPDKNVNRGLMQRQFNSWLKKNGVLSGRMLDNEFDYDRKFFLVESAIGNKIDAGLEIIREQYSDLSEIVNEQFDYLTRKYLLEAIKAKEIIPTIQQYLDLGRKVVVFHDYIKGGGFNPFDLSVYADSQLPSGRDGRDGETIGDRVKEFMSNHVDLVTLPLDNLKSPIDTLRESFPNALLEVNGQTVSKKQAQANVNKFNNDNEKPSILLVQSDKDKGWSGHDTTGKNPRVLINLGLPTRPTRAIQQEGRIYRVGQASNAVFRYINTGTNWERWAFADTIARRASTAENLAMGEEARALLDSFVEEFQNSDTYTPGHEGEGTGGKEKDKAANNALTEWDRAISLYYSQQKRTSRNRSQEGTDYFATPEPIGLKMVEWAKITAGEKVLEPSAGHGAIARWFPDNTLITMIEPSNELASKAKMAVDGKMLQTRFEDVSVVNKFDAIVMNPPFGVAGKTAMEHIEKAYKHLNDGGRIVALVPAGNSMEKRLNDFLYGEDKNGKLKNPHIYKIASYDLPTNVFERAGTSVASRIIILDKYTNPDIAQNINSQAIIGDEDHENINDLFDSIKNIDVPDRLAVPLLGKYSQQRDELQALATGGRDAKIESSTQTTTQAEGETIIEHTTQKGKVLRGVVRKGITKEDAKKIDPYTFKKDGGFFIREAHLAKAQYSKTQPSKTSTPASLDELPRKQRKIVDALIKNGSVSPITNTQALNLLQQKGEIVDAKYSKDGLIQGFVLNGKAYIVPENIESGKMWGVIRHEVGTHIGQMLLNDPEFNRLKNRVKLRRDEQSPTGEAIRKAYARAEAADTKPEFMEEEVLGYLVEDSPDVSIARKIIALIKKYLAKIGINYDLTQADMVALADIAVRREANRRDKNRQQGDAKFAFAGAKAKTANSPMLAKAQEMKAQGKSREQIWKETGWWEIVPNQWSFEIDDSDSLPDIRFSIATPAAQAQPFSIPDKMNLLDSFKDNYVNQLMAIKKAQDAVGGVSPKADLFTKESLRLSKAADEIKQGIEKYVNPMLKLMADSKFTIADVNEYVYSRHAKEANERLKYTTAKEWLLRLDKVRKNSKMAEAIKEIDASLESHPFANPKDLYFKTLDSEMSKAQTAEEKALKDKWTEFISKPSGMTNQEAKDLQDKWKQHPNYKQMEKIAEYFDAMNQEKLLISYKAGRMTEEEYEAIKGTFQYYAPLHREGFEDSFGGGHGKGLTNLGRDTMARGGSTKKAVDMFQHAVNDYQTTILKAHKAESTRAFKNFVDSLPEDNGFIEYIEAPTKAEYDRSGNIRHVLSHNLQPNEVDFKVDGVLYIARANPKNEYARRIIEQIKFNPEKTGVLVKALSKFNRVLAMVNTSLSPEFLFTNFIKDLEAASINLQATEVSNMTKQVVKDLPIVMNGLHNYMRGNKSHKLTPIIKRYFASGASVGWLDSIGTIEEKTQKLQDELDKLKPLSEVQGNKQKVKIASKKLWDRTGAILMDYNSVVENALRVSAFKSALDAGVSEEQAAMLAKNLTVNFNAKGLHGQVMNSLYLFSNAGIQGSAKVISVLMKSKKARQIIGASVVLSVGLAIANSMIGGDDDDGVSYYEKIDDFQKQRNIIFMLPNSKGKYVSIPLPWGYNVFWKLGEEVGTAIATWDRYKPLDGVSRMITTTLNAFNPLQSGTLLQTVTPTILDPLASWGENKNWSGSPLMPEQNQFSKYPEPNSQRFFPSARKLSVDIAQGLNSLTGGNEIKSGLVDISPETLDLVWDTFTGSAGKFVANTVNVPVKMLAGEELSNREIPFYRRFVGEKSDYVDEQIFRKNVSHIYQLHDQAEKYPERAREFKKDKAYYLLNNLQAVEKRLRRLYKKRKALTAKEDIDRIQETINNTKMKFNTLYNKSF